MDRGKSRRDFFQKYVWWPFKSSANHQSWFYPDSACSAELDCWLAGGTKQKQISSIFPFILKVEVILFQECIFIPLENKLIWPRVQNDWTLALLYKMYTIFHLTFFHCRYAGEYEPDGRQFIIVCGNINYETVTTFLADFFHPSRHVSLPFFRAPLTLACSFLNYFLSVFVTARTNQLNEEQVTASHIQDMHKSYTIGHKQVFLQVKLN